MSRDKTTVWFHKADYKIMADFLDGKCVCLCIGKGKRDEIHECYDPMSIEETDTIVQANIGGRLSEQYRVEGSMEVWTSKDGLLTATYAGKGTHLLMIQTVANKEAMAAKRDAERKAGLKGF